MPAATSMTQIPVQVGDAPQVEAFLAERIYEYNAAATGYHDAQSFSALRKKGGSVHEVVARQGAWRRAAYRGRASCAHEALP
jgi:hypothetical protein